ncbi:MAG: sugar phosphate isomerase/epimerase, partial [Armatimonadetes bacterium]|nr:sugar phosphate isomerase/epimerase [Candidatus Hippobium faecium]
MKTGLQLYTIRDFMEKDFFGSIEKVAEIGFKAVEFAGYYDNDVKEIKKFIDGLGLECCSSHLPMPTEENVDRICAELDILGTENWVGNAQPTMRGAMDPFVQYLKGAQMLADRGFNMLMHNHWWEHEMKIDGIPFYEYALEEIPDLYSQLDCGWCYVGGFDPVERIKTYNDKVILLHTKDCTVKKEDSWNGGCLERKTIVEQVANGDGDANIKGCVQASAAEYAIVELD